MIAVFSYERERRLRVALIHGMARMAAFMASNYKPYIGFGLGPLEVAKELKLFLILIMNIKKVKLAFHIVQPTNS
jgi:hypothetical protein